jgi:hypothetical protein
MAAANRVVAEHLLTAYAGESILFRAKEMLY